MRFVSALFTTLSIDHHISFAATGCDSLASTKKTLCSWKIGGDPF
jgi:hypothetical protein